MASALHVRLSIAEKEIADLKVILERSRSFRWALVATLIGVVLSSISSAIIAFYVKPKRSLANTNSTRGLDPAGQRGKLDSECVGSIRRLST